MLESLEQRLGQQGDARAARQVRFEAEQQRRLLDTADCGPHLGACLASEAEWLLWTYPTRNGSDPTLLLATLIFLWCGIAVASLPPGRLLAAARGEPQHPAPIYASVSTREGRKSAYRMVDSNRLRGALSFATAIVLKLGGCRLRWARPASCPWAVLSAFALRGTWLVAWALLLLVGKVLLVSFPGLDFIRPG
jgi:hypothetical protein